MPAADRTATPSASALLTSVLEGRDAEAVRLNEHEASELLRAAGVACADGAVLPADADAAGRTAWAERAAAIAAPHDRVVLKILGRELLHKSDVGGVRLVEVPAADAATTLLEAADAMLGTVRGRVGAAAVEGVLAAAFTPHRADTPGVEVLLSLRQDPAFGPVVVVGVGGVLTEWYGRLSGGRSRLILPARGLTEAAVRETLAAHPALSLVCGTSRLHREPPMPLAELAGAVLALGALAVEFGADRPGPTLEELEVNPAVASDGGLVAIDGVGLVSRRAWPAGRRPLARVARLLDPRSAVVLGASAKGVNPGRIILNNLRASPGIDPSRLHVIHPKQDAIDGVPCRRTLGDLPEKVDLAVVCIPAEGARDAIAEIVAGDLAESIILIPGGFAEAGHGDLAREIEDVLAAGHAREGQGPVLVGGNCLGIVSRDRYNTFFLPDYKLPFRPAEAGRNLALVSQSGAYLVTFASNYDGLINPRASISFGNQMDLTVTDFLEHFLASGDVDVVACYVEGFRAGDGARFLDAARRARAAGVSVLVFKAGKTPLGAKAAASHTASLAGDYDVAAACLTDAGVVLAETLDEFEDLIQTFTLLHDRSPRGRRTGVVSNAGFECSTVMDVVGGLELPGFDAEVRAALDAALPPFAHRDNPVDATPMADTAAYAAAARAILASDGIDALILSAVPVTPALDNLPADPQRHREDLAAPGSQAGLFREILGATDKPAVVVVDSGRLYDPLVDALRTAGIPVFRKIDRAGRCLARFVQARLDAPVRGEGR